MKGRLIALGSLAWCLAWLGFAVAVPSSRSTLEGLKARAAFLVPESLEDIVARAGPFADLQPWECPALVEACREGTIDRDDVPRLVAFFSREKCGRAGQDALIRLVRRYRLEPETLRRVFDAERQRGRFDRRSAVLEALAGNAGATPEFLRALRDLEAPSSHARTASLRLRELGEADG